MPTKTHIADKCALGAAVAIHLVHSRFLSFVNSTIFLRQFILLILFGACSKRPHYRGYGSQPHHCSRNIIHLTQLTESNLVASHEKNKIANCCVFHCRYQALCQFLSCRVAGLRLQLFFVALATFIKTFTSKLSI